ncbi:MAG: hypothetical protein HOQ34_19640, partial [Gemmatimonadaceae bacterium]|nr:hypothetical protein [Gemmatimonadaceae bacterium]
ILRTTTRPRDEGGPAVKPLFTSAEMDEMDIAYNMGLSAAGFAARLVARDKAPHGLCGNLTCRRPLPAIQPYPGYCNAGCCRERFGS